MGNKVVIPGELLTSNVKNTGDNVFVKDGKAFSQVFGVYSEKPDFVKVVPLAGKYLPKQNDLVIGVVEDVKFAGALVSIGSVSWCFLPSVEVPRNTEFRVGDLSLARVGDVDERNDAKLTAGSRLTGGTVFEVSPAKVPRIIGTKHSMINLLKDKTGCRIIVGFNGRVWVNGENQDLVIAAVRMIEKQSHLPGLTDKIKSFLEGELHGKK
ncbi:MAG: RNA-binding protein [Candidatus Diapherotrites archaeon]|nr:RNA-binding protein [Candidatus Diapherotrites archaeon]